MNAQRRKQIVKAAGLIAEARNILENVMNVMTMSIMEKIWIFAEI